MTPAAPVFSKLNRLEIEKARRDGCLTVEKTLSAFRTEPLAPPFFFNRLTFQYAVWGHIFFTALGERHISARQAIEVLRLQPGRVVAHDGVVLLKDDHALDALLQFVHAHDPESFFRNIDGALHLRQAAARPVAGNYFLGFVPGDQNYAHWVTCTLPAWLYFRNDLLPTGAKLIVGKCNRFQNEALELLGIPESALFHMPLEIVEFEALSMLSPIDMWCAGLYVGAMGRAIADMATAGGGRPLPGRVYLSRRDIATRRLLNESRAEAMLVHHGFAPVLCSELNFADQVRHMASADIVVALHGAALGNIIFCRPGTRVIEVFPEYCAQPHFRVLAHLARLQYGFVQGTSFEPENARRTNNTWDGDFVIDIGLLEAAIDAAERLGRC
jgi:capsular polysaccharide biosynthesis protein